MELTLLTTVWNRSPVDMDIFIPVRSWLFMDKSQGMQYLMMNCWFAGKTTIVQSQCDFLIFIIYNQTLRYCYKCSKNMVTTGQSLYNERIPREHRTKPCTLHRTLWLKLGFCVCRYLNEFPHAFRSFLLNRRPLFTLTLLSFQHIFQTFSLFSFCS